MGFPWPAAQPAEIPTCFCQSWCPLYMLVPATQPEPEPLTHRRTSALPSPFSGAAKTMPGSVGTAEPPHARVPPKATEPKHRDCAALPKSLGKWAVVWECLSHILGRGFADLPVFPLASCIWARESKAQHPTEPFLAK